MGGIDMAQKQILALPSVSVLAVGDMVPTSQAADSVTRQFTVTQLFTLYDTLAHTFTIGPVAPTAAPGTNTTQVATTALVTAGFSPAARTSGVAPYFAITAPADTTL